MVDQIVFNSGDECKQGAVLLKLRAEDDIAKLQSLEATAALAGSTISATCGSSRSQAVSQADGRHRRGQSEDAKAQVAEQQAIGRQKDVARAVCRASRHPRGRYRPISQRRHRDRDAAGARSDLSSISSCRSRPQPGHGRADGAVKVDAYPGPEFPGRDHGGQPLVDTATRNVQMRATMQESGSRLLPGMYREGRHRRRRAAATTSRCRRRRSPTTPTATRSTSSTAQERRSQAAKQAQPNTRRATQTFVTTGRDARRPGRGAERRQGGRRRRHRRADQAA